MALPAAVIDCLSPMDPQPTGMIPQLRPLPHVRAVLFDVYGTLLISNAGEPGRSAISRPEECMRAALLEAGLPTTDASHAAIQFRECLESTNNKARERGVTHPEVDIREIWRLLANKFSWRIMDEDLENLAMHYEALNNPIHTMPGAKRLLQELQAGAFSLGIISNAQFYTRPFVEHLIGSLSGLGFDDQLCFWSFREGRGKPSPELFEKADGELRNRGIGAREILFVGNDMRNDIEVPSRLGWRTALFAGDARSLRLREGEGSVRPDLLITRLDQLNLDLFQTVE